MKLLNLRKYLAVILISSLYLVNSSCDNKSELINVTLKIIDSETKKTRKNDSIELRIEKFGFPVKQYCLVEKYLSDSIGEVKIQIQKDEAYHVIVFGKQIFGSANFGKYGVKDGEVVIVDVVKIKI